MNRDRPFRVKTWSCGSGLWSLFRVRRQAGPRCHPVRLAAIPVLIRRRDWPGKVPSPAAQYIAGRARSGCPARPAGLFMVRAPAQLQEIFLNMHALAGSGYSHRNDGAETGPSTSSPTNG